MIRANANADVNMKANPSVRTSMETGASASGNVKANAYAHAHTKTSATANAAAERPARDLPTRLAHAAAAITLTVSGYIHAQLYLDGYRFIHAVGVMFLIQAAASFALATLLLAAAVIDPPVLVQLAAAGAALGALAGFAASRTVGVFGFTERGLQPAPQALLSVLAEIATVLLLGFAAVRLVRRRGGCRRLVNRVFT